MDREIAVCKKKKEQKKKSTFGPVYLVTRPCARRLMGMRSGGWLLSAVLLKAARVGTAS